MNCTSSIVIFLLTASFSTPFCEGKPRCDSLPSCWFSTTTTELSSSSDIWHVEHIGLDKAWDIQTGHSSVKIAHIDTGIKLSHPDLSGRIDTQLSTGAFSSISSDWFDPLYSHGTMTAGILAATPNNGSAVGVDWNAQIVCIRADGPIDNPVEGEEGHETVSGIVGSINYATQHGIPIISYSGGFNQLWGTSPDVVADRNMLQTAVNNYPGLLVCAAGNSNWDLDSSLTSNRVYPACFTNDNILTVGASTRLDGKSSPSNYGASSVDVFAPGEDIVGSSHSGSGPISGSGTSAACPIVAGLAALIKSVNSTLTPLQIKSIIMDTVDKNNDPSCDISDLWDRCVSHGRINAYRALMAAIPDYVDSGSGMACPNGVRPGANEWVRISGLGGKKDIHSTGGCPASGTLYGADINSGAIATGTQNTSYPYGYSLYKNLSSSSTYYLKSVVQTPLSSSFGVSIDTHVHDYDSYQWKNLTYHYNKCGACGHLGTIAVHAVSPSNPNICLLCGGQANGGITPFSEGPIFVDCETAEAFLSGRLSAEELEELVYA